MFYLLLLFMDLTNSYMLSIGLGWFIAFLYIVTGFILFFIALKFKNKSFAKMVTFAVFGRLIFAVVGITFVIKFLNIHNTIFIITLFSFYFIFQIMEVVGLNKISIKGV
jgi:hypothetical protein